MQWTMRPTRRTAQCSEGTAVSATGSDGFKLCSCGRGKRSLRDLALLSIIILSYFLRMKTHSLPKVFLQQSKRGWMDTPNSAHLEIVLDGHYLTKIEP